MARYTGKDLEVQWIHSGGTAVVDTDYRSFSTSEEIDTADKSAGDDTHRSFIPTLKDTTAELEMLDTGQAGTATWNAVAPGTEGTVIWGPEGTASGKPKYTAAAFVESREREFPYDDVVSTTVAFHLQAVPTAASW